MYAHNAIVWDILNYIMRHTIVDVMNYIIYMSMNVNFVLINMVIVKHVMMKFVYLVMRHFCTIMRQTHVIVVNIRI